MKKLIIIIAFVGLAIGLGVFLAKQKEVVSTLEKPKKYTKNIEVLAPSEKEVSKYREFLAQVISKNSAYIASKFSATVKKIYVNESDHVKKGELLVSLDDSELKATLLSIRDKESALKVDVANDKTNLDRNRKLLDVSAISKEEYDNSNVIYQNKLSSLKGINQNIQQIKSQLKYLNIKSPFDGVVGSKTVDVGSLVSQGKPILTINSKDQKLIFSFVPTSNPIAQGQKVYIGKKLIGTISKIYDNAKDSLLIAEVKPYKILPFANKSYKTIKVEVDKQKGCALPLNAFLHKNDKTYIMLYKDKKFTSQEVNMILEGDNDVVLSKCPNGSVAIGSEAKLSILPAFGIVNITKGR